MTSQMRPNLGGLFNGSTPADRTSSIAGRLGPRLVVPIDAPSGASTSANADASAVGPGNGRPAAERQDAPVPEGDSDQRPVLAWLDPVKALELYFGLLQAVLDANRDLAITLTQAIVKVPRRLR